MFFTLLPFLIMAAINFAITGIMYLLRTKQGKGDVFDSKTYHADGMENSIDVGAPIPIPYGTHKFAPHIINYYIAAMGDYTRVSALCSFGEGMINGLRDIRINNQSIFSLFGSRRNYSFWLTLGESRQKVYGYYKDDDTTIKTVHASPIGDITTGFNQTITYELDAHSKDFEEASAAEPGYFEALKGEQSDDPDTIEIIQYTGKTTVGGEKQLTGCRVTKNHVSVIGRRLRQTYQKVYNDAGNLLEVIPGMNITVVKHQEVGLLVTQSGSVVKTTENKVEALGVVVGFRNGLYGFDKEDGYRKAACQIQIKWWKDGTSWSGNVVFTEILRTQTADMGDYIRIPKKKNYCWLVDSTGAFKEGVLDATISNNLLDQTHFDKIEDGDTLEFTLGGTTYICEVTAPPTPEPTGWAHGVEIFRYKLYFRQLDPPPTDGKYNGPKTEKVAFAVKYKQKEKSNMLNYTFFPGSAKLAEYRWTFLLPNIKKFGKLDYAKYNVEVKKITKDMNDPENGQNSLTFIELQEITIDNLSYPHEVLFGFEINMNKKISGDISNITAVMEGRLLKDVQNPANPDRMSSNPYDIVSDIITNKRYGRGRDINLSASELTGFYAALAPEAAHADHAITENSRTRKRFELNAIIDFKKPTIDLLRALAITFRGNIYWDGVKPLCFTDRATTPTAMFGPVSIVPGSFKLQSLKLAEQVNRVYSQFLNKSKNWTQDSVSHDFRGEGFTISKLKQKDISLYGITDGWRASKTNKYLLRLAKYMTHGIQFTTTNDAVTTDIGKTFYWVNKNGATGRILAVGSNNVTLDKAFTIASGKTYKALMRKDDGTPHAELTVDNTATGVGSKTVIYFTASISGITLASCPIYGIGLSGKYYDTYRCVTKNAKGNEHEIIGSLYNAEVYRLHKNDPSSDPSASADTVEHITTPTVIESENAFPPNVLSLIVRENIKTIGSADVHVTRPPGLVWAYCEIFIRDEETEIERPAGISYGEPIHITGLKLNKEYLVRATSYSKTGRANPNPFNVSITIEGTKPPMVTGLKIINNKGTASEVFGRDFEVRCDDMTSNRSHVFVKQTNEYEGLRYLWQVYYSNETDYGIPDSVKLGGMKVNTKEAYRLVSRENSFKFSLENNIERIKAMYASHKIDAPTDYNTYYGNPRREITVKVSLINAWGELSPSPTELVMMNPPPDMKDSAGVVMTPVLRKIKNGHRIMVTHPAREYDIIDYVVFCATNAAFTQNVKRYIIPSVITVDSSDEDVGNAAYKIEIDGLDKKNTYYYKITPRDAFGKGTASNTVSGVPGGNHDEDGEDIVKPTTITGLTLTAINKINTDGTNITDIKAKWTKLTETDIDSHNFEWCATEDINSITPPTTDQVEHGDDGSFVGETWVAGPNTVKGDIKEGKKDGRVSNRNYMILKAATHNMKYFGRVQGINTGGQYGDWSSWASIAITKANNAVDSTAPSLPSSVTVTAEQTTLKIKITTTTAARDLAGYQISIKEGASEGASVSFSSDHAPNVKTSIAVTADNATATYNYTGKAGFNYIVAANAYDKSDNVNSGWTEASAQVLLEGLTADGLSDPVSLAIYTGSFTANDADTVSWAGGSKVKIKRTGGNTKQYTINSGNTGNLAGTRYIVFNKDTSTTAFSVVSTPSDTDIVIVRVEPVSSGKANIARFVGNAEGEYSIGRYSGSFNQLSAMVAEFGRILMTSDGYIKILIDSTTTPPVIRVAKDGYNATETDPDKLRWSSELNNFKIIDQGVGSFTLPGYTVIAGGYNSSIVTIKSGIGISTARGVVGFSDIGGGYGAYRRKLPIKSGYGNSESFEVSIGYSPNDSAIICVSQAWNWGAGIQTVNALNFNLAWYLLGETLE